MHRYETSATHRQFIGSDGSAPEERIELVRGLYGLCQLVAPTFLAGRVLGAQVSGRASAVIRVLGARHLAQSAFILWADNAISNRSECRSSSASATVHGLGGGVDALHSLSMVFLGLLRPAHRRAALADAAVAATFATREVRT